MAGTLTTRESRELQPQLSRNPLLRLREEMEDLFSRFFGDGENGGWLSAATAPSLDLSETDEATEVRIDLPGVKPEEIDIQLVGNTLRISGEHEEEKEEKGKTFHRVERRSGKFSRSVTLPCGVQEDQIEARDENGVLTVKLPKAPGATTRKIEVKAS